MSSCRSVFRSLGQEVFCSVREADYEIASYARCHGSMGILAQDSDFIIFNRSKSLNIDLFVIYSVYFVMYIEHNLHEQCFIRCL